MIGPLGVTTGVLISQIATPLMDAIIVAVTAGTFLYVGATEVSKILKYFIVNCLLKMILMNV